MALMIAAGASTPQLPRQQSRWGIKLHNPCGARAAAWRRAARKAKGAKGEAGGPNEPAPLRSEDAAALLRAVRLQQVARSKANSSSSDGGGGKLGGAGGKAEAAAAVLVAEAAQPVPVHWVEADPFPGSEPEPLSPADLPAAASSSSPDDLAKAAKQFASSAADLADAAAAVAKASAAASPEEVLFTAQQLASDVASDAADVASAMQAAATGLQRDVASDAADVAGAVQAAVDDVQQQAAKAVASVAQAVADTSAASVNSSTSVSSQSAPATNPASPVSPASQLPAPEEPAGALPEPEQPVAALPATTSASTTPPPPPPSPSAAEEGKAADIAKLKGQLIQMLASLDRGTAATDDQMERADALCCRLEQLGGPVVLSWEKPASGGKSPMALLDGRWRLLYSSGFASGSLGGRRPGPAVSTLAPVQVGQVYQDIFTDKQQLDNVVELFLRFSLASLPIPGLTASPPTATLRLKHSYAIQGSSTIEITFDATELKVAGGLQQWLDQLPPLDLPQLPESLRPPRTLRSASFDVVYLDQDMRITRGDRGELRVFLKGET